ncbi:MAG: hypothetical protein IT378_00595 [Sandaracinaceae bacterium]|nr:hypothetical protein [Sandaracinaceae bacterium]
MQTTPVSSPRTARSLDLSDLAAMRASELAALYAKGRVPNSLAALDGHPRGRMLAVRGLDRGRASSILRSLSGAARFPWGGKSFASGGGINRVHLGGRHQLFPFRTSFAPSVIDGAPCVKLDYDLTDNPAFIRKIHDEIREIDPALFLGPAMWKRAGRAPALVLWFALDGGADRAGGTNQPHARAVGT